MASTAPDPHTPYRADTTPTLHAEVDGTRYAYRDLAPLDAGPSRVPLVFLHRFRGTLDDWDPAFVDAVARHRRVILFSDAAVGSSSGSPATTVDAKAANAAAFIRSLGLAQADVLGFSMGGFVAQAVALAEPDLLRRVVLVGTGPAGNPEAAPPTDIVFQIALRPDYSFEDVRYLFFSEGRDAETRQYVERSLVRREREPVVGPETIEAMVGLVLEFMNGKTDHFGRLPTLRQPVLIVSGDDDPFFPVKNQWLLHRELPDARLSIFPRAGHGPHQQHPDAVAAQIEEFLSSP